MSAIMPIRMPYKVSLQNRRKIGVLKIEFLYSLIGTPLGYLMWLLYLIVKNFGVAVILFTLVVKAVSFPLTLKQQKNMTAMQLFTPRVQEIQKKYRNNQQKMQEEMQKLQKEGYSPFGGCGPMFLTMIILFGVLDVVYKPMTHMERLDKTTISHVQELARQTQYTEIILLHEAGETEIVLNITDKQRREIGEVIIKNPTEYAGYDALPDTVKSSLKTVDNRYKQLQRELASVLQYSKYPDAFSSLEPEVQKKLENLKENMVFFGVNLGQVPHFTTYNSLWFIVLFAFVMSTAQMLVQQQINKKTMPNNPAQGSMKFMMIMAPMFSLIIGFSFPAGASLYWGVSYIFMIGQSLIIYKFWPPEVMKAEAKARVQAKNGGVEITAKVEDIDEEGNTVVKEEKLSDMSRKEQDEYYRKKLEEAREADRVKYGDESQLAVGSAEITVEENIQEPESRELERKAKNGDPQAQLDLAREYFKSIEEKGDKNAEMCAIWAKKAASNKKALAKAQWWLGDLYEYGDIEPFILINKYEAIKWYKKSAEQGYKTAQCTYGQCLYQGEVSGVENYNEAFELAKEWFLKAGTEDKDGNANSEAQYRLALCYALGNQKNNNTGKDEKKAMEWYEKAAKQEHPDAQCMLGFDYTIAAGKAQLVNNKDEAIKLYKEACEWLTRGINGVDGVKLEEAENQLSIIKKSLSKLEGEKE